MANPTPKTSTISLPSERVSSRQFDAFRLSHAILIGFAFLIFALSGSMLRLFRFKYIVRVHYCTQIFALAMMFAGFATGVWLANLDDKFGWSHAAGHEILGTVLMPLALVPLTFGYFQHRHWKQHRIRTWRNDAHIWSARAVIVLGIVDGCIPNIGLTYTFGMPALLVLVVYAVFVARYEWKRRREGKSTGRTEVVEADGRVKEERAEEDGIESAELEAKRKGTGREVQSVEVA